MTSIPITAARAIVLAFALTAAAAPAARAGTYDVHSCGGAAGGQDNAWVQSADAGMAAYDSCPNSPNTIHTGLVTRTSVGSGSVGFLAGASQVFSAPAGTSLVDMSFDAAPYRAENHWTVGFVAYDADPFAGDLVWGCYANQAGCAIVPANFSGPYSVALGGRRNVRLDTRCGNWGGCSLASTGSPPYVRASIAIANVRVRVRDDVAPSVAPSHGALYGGGWHRGVQQAWQQTADNAGVRVSRLLVDGRVRESQDYAGGGWPSGVACDFTRARPCNDVFTGHTLDTATLADGAHALRVEAVDAAGNVAGVERTLAVDNNAPAPPTAVTVVGGEDWRAANGFTVEYRVPDGQAAPVVRAHWRLCLQGGACAIGSQDDSDARLTGLAVPEPGDYTLRLWLEDAAGNANGEALSDPVHLRFDDRAPGRAQVTTHDGWLGAAEADRSQARFALAAAAFRPVSGIRGWSVTTDGGEPDATVDVTGESLSVSEFAEGVTTVRARAISGAGVPSTEIGAADVRIDRTAPTATGEGAPDAAQWQRAPVALTLGGADQEAVSGMAAGRIVYRVDGGAAVEDPGPDAGLTVGDDGRHVVTFRAFDAAGNASPERALGFLIDRTPPETVGFEAPDPADPQRVSAIAVDATSGVAAGRIELRRVPAANRRADGEWTRLETRLAGDRLVSRLDDGELPGGRYELRARVRDRAGNERVSDRAAATGERFELELPLRIVSRVAAGTRVQRTTRCRTLRSAGRPLRVCRATRVRRRRNGRRFVVTIRPRVDRRTTVHGALETADGLPIGAAALVVEEEPRSGGGFRAVRELRTDRLGRFAYAVPGGPSRTIRFRYAGSQVIRPSLGEVRVLVPARTTIAVDRRALRNGETVRFSGRLQGGFVPEGGKLVDLQAFYRGRWRTFATPRTDAGGAWAHDYRFEATVGRVAYRFRARVRREAAYPFELGVSRAVTVVVTG